MSKFKIAFFVEVMEEDFDGVAHTYHQIIPKIAKDKVDIVFFTPLPPKKDIGFKVVNSPYIFMPLQKQYRIGLPKLTSKIKNELESFSPDLIHFSSPSSMGKYAIKYAKKRNIPVTTIYHTHFPSYFSYYIKRFPFLKLFSNYTLKIFHWFYHNVTHVFVPSKEMKTYLLKQSVKELNISYFKRGVNIKKFSPEHLNPYFKEKYQIKESKIVLFVSRLVYEKDIETLAKVYEKFQKKDTNTAFLVVGTGAGEGYLRKKMPNAYFTGKLIGTDLAEVYASSDIFLFPSISETFGNVVLESLASGTPVVAANEGGPTDIISNNENGFLVEPKNIDLFVEKTLLLLEDDNLRKKFSEKAVEYAKTQSWSAICNGLFQQFYKLIENHK